MQKNADDEVEKQRLDLQLDDELRDTFPASDALKITRRRTHKPQSARTGAALTVTYAKPKPE